MTQVDEKRSGVKQSSSGDDVSVLKAALVERQKTVHRLRVEIANLKSENAELRGSKDSERQRLADLEIRLAEVSADYRNALAMIQERGEAQAAALAASQDLTGQVSALSAQLATAQRELATKEEQIQRLDALEKETARRLAEVSADYRNALAMIQERGEAQERALAAYQALAAEVAVLQAQLSLKDQEALAQAEHLRQIEASEKQTATRLAEVSADYRNALAMIQERGEAQAAALAAYQGLAEDLAAKKALLDHEQALNRQIQIDLQAKEGEIERLKGEVQQAQTWLAVIEAEERLAQESDRVAEAAHQDLDRLRDSITKIGQGLDEVAVPSIDAESPVPQRAQPYLTPIAVEILRKRTRRI